MMSKAACLVLTLALSSASALADANLPVLECDGGAAKILVDPLERRKVKLVVEDRSITRYLESTEPQLQKFIDGDDRLSAEALFFHGVFRPSDFRGFELRLGEPAFHRNANVRRLRVFRQGRGLKVQIVNPAAYVCFYPARSESGGTYIEYPIDSQFCPGWGFFNDPGSFVERRPEREISNWYFQSCDSID